MDDIKQIILYDITFDASTMILMIFVLGFIMRIFNHIRHINTELRKLESLINQLILSKVMLLDNPTHIENVIDQSVTNEGKDGVT